MLNTKGIIIRYIICLSCFFISGTQIITGWPATICGILGTIELATALLHYSPLNDLIDKLVGVMADNLTSTAKGAQY